MVGTATHYTGETTIDKLSVQYMTGYLNPDYYGSSILGFTGTSSSYV